MGNLSREATSLRRHLRFIREWAVLSVLPAGVAVLLACSTDMADTPIATAPVEPTSIPTPPAPSPTPFPTSTPASRSTPTPVEQVSHSIPAPSLIMLQDPLDEPEFYCVDVAGFGASLNLNSPLQAHTCKPGADDEMFAFNRPSQGHLHLVEHDLCVEADEAMVYVRRCSDSPMQVFTYGKDRTLSLETGDFCLVAAGGEGQPAGGRSHLRRDLLVMPCTDADRSLSQWVFPGPRPN